MLAKCGAADSRYVAPVLNACIYHKQSAVLLVMMSLHLNESVTHKFLASNIVDKLGLMLSLVKAWNSSLQQPAQVNAGAGAAAVVQAAPVGPHLSKTTVTHAQLCALASGQEPTVRSVKSKQVTPTAFAIFQWACTFGEAILSEEHPSWNTIQLKEDKSADLLQESWLTAAAMDVKMRTYMPTAAKLTALKEVEPWQQAVKPLAEFILERLMYCRDTTTARKRYHSPLSTDDPQQCHSADTSKKVTKQACAVYLQLLLAKGQTKAALG